MADRIIRIKYTKKTCGRCGGSGTYSYCQRYGNTCFGCHGSGTKIDANGKRALAKVSEWKVANCTRTMDELAVGDQIRETIHLIDQIVSRWVRFVRIDGDRAIFTGKAHGEWVPAETAIQSDTFEIRPMGDLFQQMAEFADKYKGVEVVWESEAAEK